MAGLPGQPNGKNLHATYHWLIQKVNVINQHATHYWLTQTTNVRNQQAAYCRLTELPCYISLSTLPLPGSSMLHTDGLPKQPVSGTNKLHIAGLLNYHATYLYPHYHSQEAACSILMAYPNNQCQEPASCILQAYWTTMLHISIHTTTLRKQHAPYWWLTQTTNVRNQQAAYCRLTELPCYISLSTLPLPGSSMLHTDGLPRQPVSATSKLHIAGLLNYHATYLYPHYHSQEAVCSILMAYPDSQCQEPASYIMQTYSASTLHISIHTATPRKQHASYWWLTQTASVRNQQAIYCRLTQLARYISLSTLPLPGSSMLHTDGLPRQPVSGTSKLYIADLLS